MLETKFIVARGRDFTSHRQKKALLASTWRKVNSKHLAIYTHKNFVRFFNCLFKEFIWNLISWSIYLLYLFYDFQRNRENFWQKSITDNKNQYDRAKKKYVPVFSNADRTKVLLERFINIVNKRVPCRYYCRRFWQDLH